MKIDYENERKKIVDVKNGARKKLLLHCCCAPCSSACLERVVDDFDVCAFFFNPNMDCQDEYEKRASELQRYIQSVYGCSIKVVCADYDNAPFYKAVKGLENEPEGGKRCIECFRLRLLETCMYASENGYDYVGTTLSVSPYKNADNLNTIGEECAKKCNVMWLPSDFKKDGGYSRSISLSAQYGLYRQNYCGCVFSKAEAEKRRAARVGKAKY